MSYTVLARKYRPATFDEVIGQSHVCTALKNSLDNQKIHHAYLLSGTRGVGKTTLGRLFAKALNCDKGVSSQPCGECSPCESLAAGGFLDLIEVDGASRTKVDETRELLDNVQYAPSIGRFKIYLIDEVHMLSTHSFNALLKTLEEPPAHVKFILATTDPAKLPVTVLSRCLQLNLKHINKETISSELQVISKKEGVILTATSANLIALHAYGSMRDALSLLDQAIALGNGVVTDELTENMIGVTNREKVMDLLDAIISKDITQTLTIADEVVNLGSDLHALLQDIASMFQEMALMMLLDKASFTDIRDQRLYELSKLSDPQEIQMLYQMALIGCRDMPICRTPDTSFKMAILRMIVFQEGADTAPQTQPLAVKKPLSSKQQEQPIITETVEKKRPVLSVDNWNDKVIELTAQGALQELVRNIQLTKVDGNCYTFILDSSSEHLLTSNIKSGLNECLNNYLQDQIKVLVLLSVKPLDDTNKKRDEKSITNKIKQAEESFKDDETLSFLKAEFDAKIESIELTSTEEK
jgi:DNA polymerase-3 subunit gamma/tau